MKRYKRFEEAIPKYVYRVFNLKNLIEMLDNKGVHTSKDNFTSLTKEWESIYYNEDFEQIYGYTLENMCIVKYNSKELSKKNKLIEVEYTKEWMSNNKDIRDYIFGYVKDFSKEDWENDLKRLKISEQEIIGPKVLKGSLKSIDGIYVPTKEIAERLHIKYNHDPEKIKLMYPLDRTKNYSFVTSTKYF